MDNEYVSLIIANMFIVGAFVSNNVWDWAVLLCLALLWMVNYWIQANAKIKMMKRKLWLMELEKELIKKNKGSRKKK